VPSKHKSYKATGPDGVPVELFKAKKQEETVLDRMPRICVAIWETGEWPEEWTFSRFILLPKKGDLKQCANYRTIARLPRKHDPSLDHTGKVQSEDRNGNCRQTGGIPTTKGNKRANHESQNTDAQGTQAPTTTLPCPQKRPPFNFLNKSSKFDRFKYFWYVKSSAPCGLGGVVE